MTLFLLLSFYNLNRKRTPSSTIFSVLHMFSCSNKCLWCSCSTSMAQVKARFKCPETNHQITLLLMFENSHCLITSTPSHFSMSVVENAASRENQRVLHIPIIPPKRKQIFLWSTCQYVLPAKYTFSKLNKSLDKVIYNYPLKCRSGSPNYNDLNIVSEADMLLLAVISLLV